jgi:2-methylcitrate synthase
MSDADPKIHKGLAGVFADVTAISKVVPEKRRLTYRGYPVDQLAEKCSFEEVAYLLLNGALPNRRQLTAFEKDERSRRELSAKEIAVIKQFPKSAHPMDTIRTAVSLLGTRETAWGGEPRAKDLDRGMDLLAKIPAMIATDFRFRAGKPRIKPHKDLSFAANFFHMCFGKVPPTEVVKAFDISLTCYAEHSFNASTFTDRVIASTRADLYASITGAIGALKGPLHGGANEAVMEMLKEIGKPGRAEKWLRGRIAKKQLVMGFGHRVYRWGDSRVPIMRKCLEDLSRWAGDDTWIKISDVLEAVMVGEKKIYPNLDFPSGPVYYLMGFPINLYTPIFVAARVTGWIAHYLEQNADNSLIRPLSAYNGPQDRDVPSLKDRR